MNDIDALKAKARKAALRLRQFNGRGYDQVGNHLLEYISPEFASARRDFDEAMGRLRELDPDCPKKGTA